MFFKFRDDEQIKEINRLRESIENFKLKNETNSKNKTNSESFGLNGANECKNQASFILHGSETYLLQKNQISSANHHQNIPMNSVIQQLKKVLPPNSTVHHQQMNAQQQLFDDYLHNNLLFNEINRPTPVLDNEPSKFKSSLIKRGSLATRHLPQQQQQVPNKSVKSKFTNDQESLNNDNCDTENTEINDQDFDVENDEVNKFIQKLLLFE
jgi:hypothetical protein